MIPRLYVELSDNDLADILEALNKKRYEPGSSYSQFERYDNLYSRIDNKLIESQAYYDCEVYVELCINPTSSGRALARLPHNRRMTRSMEKRKARKAIKDQIAKK